MLLRSMLLLLLSLRLAHGLGFVPPLAQLQDLDLDNLSLDAHEDLGVVTEASETQESGASPEVTLPGLGKVRGKIMKSYNGRDMYTFQSLPFALPPVGKRRFQSSVIWDNTTGSSWPIEEGDDFYDATYLRAKCPQPSLLTSQIGGREDCLHLTIYSLQDPSVIKENEKLAVMYWIYGGAYLSGEASLYVPTKLLDHDVIIVVVQYRLGPLGFLAARTPDNPGNMGLSDQVTGLRWVQKHISYFGGDPDIVTVFGQSAGGSSASWMQLTPLTQGAANNGRQLLHRVIPMSGSAVEHWTIDPDPETSFQDTVELVGCNQASTQKKLDCMRKQPFEKIAQAGLTLYANDRLKGGLGFRGLCPVIQDTLLSQDEVEVLIPKDPIEILQNGEYLKIPQMGGAVRDEGSLAAALMWIDYIVPNNYTNDTEYLRDETLPMVLKGFGYVDETGGLATMAQMLFMPEDVEMGNWTSMVGGIIDLTGVLFLKSGIWEIAHKIYVNDESVPFYFYSFEFESDDSLFPFCFAANPDVPVPGGVSHADDLLYMFHLPTNFDERELHTLHRYTTLWTNFAKHGDPTPNDEDNWKKLGIEKWKPFSIEELNFMLMSDDFSMSQDFTKRWNHNKYPDISYSYTTPPPTTKTPPTTTQSPDVISDLNMGSKQKYNEVLEQKQGLQIATGIVGALFGCAILIAVILGIKLRKVYTV